MDIKDFVVITQDDTAILCTHMKKVPKMIKKYDLEEPVVKAYDFEKHCHLILKVI